MKTPFFLFAVVALFGILNASVMVFRSELELDAFILSNPMTLVLLKTKDADSNDIFRSASDFFLSTEWLRYISAIEALDFTTATCILANLKKTELGKSLGDLIDNLLNLLRSNYRFINMVRNVALIDCKQSQEICNKRIEEVDDSTDELGVVLQLYQAEFLVFSSQLSEFIEMSF